MTRSEYNNNVQQWSGNVLRFAVWNCGDRMRSEDAMQEAFAMLWEKRDRVSVDKALGFLLTVTHRYLVNCMRHDMVVAKSQEEMVREKEMSYCGNDEEMSDEMLRALRKLPEIQRTIIQLRDVEGYSYKDIADMLEITENQVQVYLFRARTSMRKCLNNNDNI